MTEPHLHADAPFQSLKERGPTEDAPLPTSSMRTIEGWLRTAGTSTLDLPAVRQPPPETKSRDLMNVLLCLLIIVVAGSAATFWIQSVKINTAATTCGGLLCP